METPTRPVAHVRALTATSVIVAGSRTLRDWHERLRQYVPDYEHTIRFKKGYWDGTWTPGRCVRIGDHWQFTGSRGWLLRLSVEFLLETERVHGEVTEAQLAAALEETVQQLHLLSPAPPGAAAAFLAQHPRGDELRDYQRDAFINTLTAGWGRVALATNAGKGAVIALLAAYATAQGDRTLILCDELAVYDALQGELRTWAGITPGRVGAGTQDVPQEPVVLAMVPTLARRITPPDPTAKRTKRLSAARVAELTETARAWRLWVATHRMVLCDEADKATAATWRNILTAATGSAWRAGFSGTFPSTVYEDLVLEDLMGPVVARIRNMALVEQGVSAKPRVLLHGFDASPPLARRPNRFIWYRQMTGPERREWVYERAVLTNPERHAFIASLVRPETPTAIIVNRIEHGAALAAAIPGAVFLDGSNTETERRACLEAFRAGTVRVIVVTKILDRGTNRLGYAADLIFASGEGSSRQTLQRIGRGLRRTDGKEFLRLVDVIDRGDKYLHLAGQKRINLYTSEGFTTEAIL